MVAIGAVYGSAEAFFRPAYTGLIPQTVPEDEIQYAQALGGMSTELATFVSPAVTTALLFWVGPSSVFAVDAATFAVSATLLLRVNARSRGLVQERTGVIAELRDGWHAVRERTWVWATILGFSIALLFALAPFFVLGAGIGESVYGSSAVYGIANAAWVSARSPGRSPARSGAPASRCAPG